MARKKATKLKAPEACPACGEDVPSGSLACPECGAAVPEGGSCRDHFHALLLLEGEIPGVAGSILHFYAVAAYGLQHPDGMNYTAEALAGLHATVAAALDEAQRPGPEAPALTPGMPNLTKPPNL